ncbi:hypothetical protein VCHENC02_1194B, partial [Vibrio harveyi]
DQKNTQIVRR